MLRCELDLGESPWHRLAAGRVAGEIRWNGGEALPVTVKIRGAHSRKFPKKSLQADLNGVRLADGPPKGHSVRRLHLNADYIDPTLMRSALSFQLFHNIGAAAPLCRHTELQISGERPQLYMALESVDSDFCARRGWKPGQIYYALNRNANFGLISPNTRTLKDPLDLGYRLVQQADPAPLRRLIMDLNLASDQRFPAVVERCIDVAGYLKWLIVAVFVGNRDGFVHNYALYREPDSGLFRIIPWDYDATWGIDVHGRPARLDRVPLEGWNRLTQRLLTSPLHRRQYKKLFVEHLNGPLSPASVLPLIDKMSAEVGAWFDTNRQDAEDRRRFSTGVTGLRWWAEQRRILLLSQLADL
ncbi:MAG TPA: CotH kinase family protein [Candidatus Sulfotelmatobacter sp.]|nr:CotH kinase family protein [Candidatus Sulfotelmatobacter sp.]HWI61225.1 CotH kinase family protein [Symbiobacteriaceae bacterium]